MLTKHGFLSLPPLGVEMEFLYSDVKPSRNPHAGGRLQVQKKRAGRHRGPVAARGCSAITGAEAAVCISAAAKPTTLLEKYTQQPNQKPETRIANKEQTGPGLQRRLGATFKTDPSGQNTVSHSRRTTVRL